MNIIPYRKDNNYVILSGTVDGLGENSLTYTQEGKAITTFDLKTYRRRRSENEEYQHDLIRVILFDDEEFVDKTANGERVLVKAELQSRNYTRPFDVTEEYVKSAIATYIEVFEKIPAQVKPESGKRVPISFKMLFDEDWIPRLPQDSMYMEDDTKNKSKERNYLYTIDENGDIYKETEHTTYELLVNYYEKLEEPLHPTKGDLNHVDLVGDIIPPINYNFLGDKGIPFFQCKVKTKSKFFEEADRYFFNILIAWDKLADEAYENINENSRVHVKGRLQSRTFEKLEKRKWITEHGNLKKDKVAVEVIIREISSSTIELVEKEPKKEFKKK